MIRRKLFPGDRSRLIGPLSLAAVAGTATLLLAGVIHAGPGGHRGPEFPISVSEARDRAEARFQALDADRSGEISPAELAAAPKGPDPFAHRRFRHHGDPHDGHRRGQWSAYGTADSAARTERHEQRRARHEAMDSNLFARLDANADGSLSADEFGSDKLRDARRQLMREHMFARMDDDGSGGLSRDELPGMSRWLESADTDGDGTVTREEMRNHRAARQETRQEARRETQRRALDAQPADQG